MRFIKKIPDVNGAYFPIQSWDGAAPADEHYLVADGVELSCGGFGELIIENDIVIGFTPNVEAWEQWQAEHTEPIPQMTTQEAILDKLTEIEYRQDLMELGLTEGGVTND